ncbi:MAG: hypothetical protein ACR2OH_00675 [Microthrixaceae bacterium]
MRSQNRNESSTKRKRTGILAAGVTVLALAASACNLPVEQWVPDFDGDGQISQAEIDRQSQVLVAAVTEAVEAQRREVQQHPFLTCVRRHESDRSGAWPYVGGYNAQNPVSSASGAYQFIDSTWRNVSVRAGHPGYAKAKHAPWYVQDEVALHLVNSGGRSAWAGTGC